jgi:hypothetical protein
MKRMTCCCCGEAAFGKQWWNRDTGFSLCVSCANRQEKTETPEFMKSCYGTRGVHYACTPKPSTMEIPCPPSSASTEPK